MSESSIPSGFTRLAVTSGFMVANGPLYGRRIDGRIVVGLLVQPQHCNNLKICHGGMLATVCDMLMGWSVADTVGAYRIPRTMNMTVDYLGYSRLGAWLQGSAEVWPAGATIVYCQALLSCNGKPVIRSNAVYKVPQEEDLQSNLLWLFPRDASAS